MEKKTNATKGNITVNTLSTLNVDREVKAGKSVLLVEVLYSDKINNASVREQIWLDVQNNEKKGSHLSETPYHVFTGIATPNFESVQGRIVNKGVEKKTRYSTLEEALKTLATKVSTTTKKATEKKATTTKKATVKKVTEKGVKTA